jgi:hypothetical protein
MKGNIGFDLDGVLYRWHQSLYTYLVVYEKLPLSYEAFWSDANLVDGYLTRQKSFHNWTRMPDLVSNMAPKRKHVEFLNKLSEKYGIYYLTHRPEEVHFSTRLWLEKWKFPQVENLIFPEMGSDKTYEIRKFEIGLYADDREGIAKATNKITNTYLVKQPWNTTGREGLKCITDILELETLENLL